MNARVTAIAGLGYGDEGKGTTIDFLARESEDVLVVRYNGGSQAAHNVEADDGLHHTFAQCGSGSLISGVRTYLSRFMLVAPDVLYEESAVLIGKGITDIRQRVYLDERAPVTTIYHRVTNRAKEKIRSGHKHGSCGMGIGETAADYEKYGRKTLLVGDLLKESVMRRKLGMIRSDKLREVEEFIQGEVGNHVEELLEGELALLRDLGLIERLIEQYTQIINEFQIVNGEFMIKEIKKKQDILFEGAQGVLLDQKYGFFPFVTRSTITFKNVDKILDAAGFQGSYTKLGITRAYMTRHGVGPFVSEDESVREVAIDEHNVTNTWQDELRFGWFDAVATRYAIDVLGGVDEIVITNIDGISSRESWKVCTHYDEFRENMLCEREGAKLPVNHDATLESQRAVTEALEKIIPLYEELHFDTRSTRSERTATVVSKISTLLGIGVSIVSTGSKASDKKRTTAQQHKAA